MCGDQIPVCAATSREGRGGEWIDKESSVWPEVGTWRRKECVETVEGVGQLQHLLLESVQPGVLSRSAVSRVTKYLSQRDTAGDTAKNRGPWRDGAVF